MLKQKHEFCSPLLQSINTRGFTSHSKSWIQLQSNNVHYHFSFTSLKCCFNSALCRQNLLDITPIFIFFLWQLREKNFTRKVWGLCTPWSSILRPPKHWFIFPFYFKTQRSYFSALGMKTRPLKFVDLARNMPLLPALFECMIFKKKNLLSRTTMVL